LVKMIDKYRNLPESERRMVDATLFTDIVKKP